MPKDDCIRCNQPMLDSDDVPLCRACQEKVLARHLRKGILQGALLVAALLLVGVSCFFVSGHVLVRIAGGFLLAAGLLGAVVGFNEVVKKSLPDVDSDFGKSVTRAWVKAERERQLPGWKHPDLAVRRRAVWVLQDQAALGEVARSDGDVSNRLVAVDRIEDQNVLADLARTSQHAGVRSKAIERLEDTELRSRILAEQKAGEPPAAKPKFALIVRTPPPPNYMSFNETVYADRVISELIPQWRNQVSWRLVIQELPGSEDQMRRLITNEVVEYRKKTPSMHGNEAFRYDFAKTRIGEFVDTEGHQGILVELFD